LRNTIVRYNIENKLDYTKFNELDPRAQPGGATGAKAPTPLNQVKVEKR